MLRVNQAHNLLVLDNSLTYVSALLLKALSFLFEKRCGGGGEGKYLSECTRKQERSSPQTLEIPSFSISPLNQHSLRELANGASAAVPRHGNVRVLRLKKSIWGICFFCLLSPPSPLARIYRR